MSHSESDSGNADNPPEKQGKFWKVNYHIKESESFESVFKLIEDNIFPICAEYIFAEEYGNSGKTKHIEGGFITRTDRTRRSAIQKLFKFSDCQKSCKRNWKALIKYCSKEGNKIIKSNGVFIPRPIELIPKDILRPNQQALVDLFKDSCPPIWNARGIIHWFWEPNGGWGKSVTSLYMIDHMDAFVVAGANKDILCGFREYVENSGNAPKVIVFDIPRCNNGHVSYQAIESMKNGFFFSGKYESGMCRFNCPHVVCFSNEEPEYSELSEDRWDVQRLL